MCLLLVLPRAELDNLGQLLKRNKFLTCSASLAQLLAKAGKGLRQMWSGWTSRTSPADRQSRKSQKCETLLALYTWGRLTGSGARANLGEALCRTMPRPMVPLPATCTLLQMLTHKLLHDRTCGPVSKSTQCSCSFAQWSANYWQRCSCPVLKVSQLVAAASASDYGLLAMCCCSCAALRRVYPCSLHTVHDEEKPFELELAWICNESDKKFQRVPVDLAQEADRAAKDALNSDM